MKKILLQNEARLKLKSGIHQLNEVVKHTLGPAGKQVIIGDLSLDPLSSDDGITCADAVELLDEFEDAGAKLARAAARKTNKVAGDGTTTTIVLTNAFVKELISESILLQPDKSLKTKLLEAQAQVLKWLEENKIEITSKEQVEHIATISSGDPVVGKMISDIYEKLGKDGVITHEENKTIGLDYEIVEGLQFDRGLVSHYLAQDRIKIKSVLKNPYILITDGKPTLPNLVEIVKKVSEAGRSEMILIADDFSDATINGLVVNFLQGFRITAIKAPYFGDRRKEFLEDIATFTGGKVVQADQATLVDLGKAQSVECTLGQTIIVGGSGDVSERVQQLRTALEATQSEYDRANLKERISKLTGGVGIIRVGCATELETRSVLAKVEDAINATRVALEDGIVEGGGVALLKASETVDNEVFKKALRSPFDQIVENGGAFDQTNLIERGVIDPVKVTKNALMNALSTALHVRLTEALVVPERKKEDDE